MSQQTTKVWISRRSSVYHYDGDCQYVSPKHRKVGLNTLNGTREECSRCGLDSEASKAGREGVCRPRTKKRKDTQVDAITEAEQRQIRETQEKWIVLNGIGGTQSMHVYQDCLSLQGRDWVAKAVDCYPDGWENICKNCLYRWREGDLRDFANGSQD